MYIYTVVSVIADLPKRSLFIRHAGKAHASEGSISLLCFSCRGSHILQSGTINAQSVRGGG